MTNIFAILPPYCIIMGRIKKNASFTAQAPNIHHFSIEDGDMTVLWGFNNAVNNENIAIAVGRWDLGGTRRIGLSKG